MAQTETRLSWAEEVRYQLLQWFYWARGNHEHTNPDNPIAALMKRAEGDLPGMPLDVPVELTPELEVTEKAVARMKNNREKVYRRLLIDTYLHGMYVCHMAADRKWSEDKTKIMLWRAESIVGRYMIEVEKQLTASLKTDSFGNVYGRVMRPT